MSEIKSGFEGRRQIEVAIEQQGIDEKFLKKIMKQYPGLEEVVIYTSNPHLKIKASDDFLEGAGIVLLLKLQISPQGLEAEDEDLWRTPTKEEFAMIRKIGKEHWGRLRAQIEKLKLQPEFGQLKMLELAAISGFFCLGEKNPTTSPGTSKMEELYGKFPERPSWQVAVIKGLIDLGIIKIGEKGELIINKE